MDEHNLSKDMIPPYEAITRVQERIYPDVGRATAELIEALGNRYVIAAGIPLVKWFGEGLSPPHSEAGYRHERISHLFWGEMPVASGQRDEHFQWGMGEFHYTRWGAGEFGYLVRDDREPVWTFTEEFEHVLINELCLLAFIRERKAIIAMRGPARADEIRAFIRAHVGRNVNTAWDEFKKSFGSRADGQSPAFRSFWKEERDNPTRGRPKNLQRRPLDAHCAQ